MQMEWKLFYGVYYTFTCTYTFVCSMDMASKRTCTCLPGYKDLVVNMLKEKYMYMYMYDENVELIIGLMLCCVCKCHFRALNSVRESSLGLLCNRAWVVCLSDTVQTDCDICITICLIHVSFFVSLHSLIVR